MGYYVNVENKEDWLTNHARLKLANAPAWEDCPNDCFIIVLIDNGPFTAAFIAYDKREYEEMTLPSDNRPKTFYFIPKDDLKPWYSE